VSVVLDASAVLVLLLDEPGAEVVAEVLSNGALSAVNLAEVLSTLTDRGADVSRLTEDLVAAGVLVEPMTEADAAQVAEFRRIDQGRLLSLGDRCCLALARRLAVPALTADRAWSELDAGVEVQQVR
jgi:ribonuclease VapC